MHIQEVVLVSGGTGLIGKRLARLLVEKGYQVIILSRNPEKHKHEGDANISYAGWDIKKQEIDISAVHKADHIIHLAGAGIADKRWSDERKKEIEQSRVQSGRLLANTLLEHNHQLKTFVSASAIGYYGEDPEIPNPQPFIEPDPAADNFLGQTCLRWEQTVEPISGLARLVKLRTGIVLSTEGGALAEFIKPVRFGIAAILGNGKQVISWIHIDDLAGMYLYALTNEKLHGVYNAVAPEPVSNKALVLHLARKKKENFFIPVHVPSAALKIALGEMSVEVLKSTTVSCSRIKNAGFAFRFPHIDKALDDLVK